MGNAGLNRSVRLCHLRFRVGFQKRSGPAACGSEGSGAEDIAFCASGVQGPDRLWAQGSHGLWLQRFCIFKA